MDQSQRELRKQWQRYEEDLLGDDESNDDGYKKTCKIYFFVKFCLKHPLILF
jgi:hypothetical protein